jgi:hypothetical protein
MLMLRGSDVDRIAYVVDTSGAADQLDAIIHAGKRKSGRTSALTTRTLLIGMLLAAQAGEGLILTSIYSTLIYEIPIDKQIELGVRATISGDPLFAQDTIDRGVRRIIKTLEFGKGSAPDLDDDERAQRQKALLQVLNSMLDVTLAPIPLRSTLAIDATSVWSFGRNPGKKDVASIRESIAYLRAQGDHDEADLLSHHLKAMVRESTKAKKGASAKDDIDPEDPKVQDLKIFQRGYDRDARSSAKTGKDGKPEWVYGYDAHLTVRTVNPGEEYTAAPILVERAVISPAGRDLVASSQLLLSSAPEVDIARTILGDRAYSNLREGNWYEFLTSLGYEQAVDMREGDQAWTDVDGMRVTAGSCHCPATPDHLEKIPRPNMGVTTDFVEAIEDRRQYACAVKESTPEKRRVQCPALAGQVRCPLRPESMAGPMELPLIERPPAADTAPPVCTQQSVTVHATNPNARARLWQKYYWGSEKQIELYNLRTAVEQKNSRIKDRHGTNMSKGFVRIAGQTAMTLAIGIICIANNVAEIETWAERHGELDDDQREHPLLKKYEESVFLELTREEVDAMTAYLVDRGLGELKAAS